MTSYRGLIVMGKKKGLKKGKCIVLVTYSALKLGKYKEKKK